MCACGNTLMEFAGVTDVFADIVDVYSYWVTCFYSEMSKQLSCDFSKKTFISCYYQF